MARRKETRFSKLQGDILADELCVKLRLVDFQNVDEDFAVGALLDVSLELVNFRSLAADDDARPSRCE